MWHVVYLPEAASEYRALPKQEQAALHNATAKLEALGSNLGYPHTSAVRSAPGIRELRPRAGRSSWRALYQEASGSILIIAAIGPEARHDAKGFRRACRNATARLDERED